MSPRYFCGQNVFGMVKPATAQNFKDLVDRYINVPVPLNVTHQAFMAMPKVERDKIKQVPYLVPAVFDSSPSRRLYEKATHCNLVFLDIDEEKDGTCPAAAFINSPDALAAQLAPLSFAAYTTASSTVEKPRMRIVVDADKIPLASYAAAVKTIARRIALPRITSESKVAVQPMFLPTLFADQDSEQDHPLIVCELHGSLFTVADITEDGHDPKSGEDQKSRSPEGADDLEFLRPVVDEITLPVAKDALNSIDPDLSYPDWLEMAMALKHQFGEDAYELFDEWSAKGAKYKDEDSTRAQWEALRQHPAGRVPVTIRSLLRSAAAAGWDASATKEKCFETTLHWIQDSSCGQSALLSQSVRRIIATPLLSQSEENALLQQVVSTAKKKWDLKISATSLHKDLQRLKATLKEKEKDGSKQMVPAWIRGVCYVAACNQFFRHHTGERYAPDPFDYLYGKRLLPTVQQLQEAGVPVNAATLSKPFVRPRDFALNNIKIPTVYDYEYDPSSPGEVFTVSEGKTFVNTYVRAHPSPNAGHQDAAADVLLNHLEHLIAEPEYRRTLLDFMAYMVQCPGKKIRWAVLLQGAEGCGKTVISEVMAAVLGKRHVKSIGGQTIFSGYTEWATGHQLVALEEVRVQGVNRHEVMNVLKPLITNTFIPINQKYEDSREVMNRTNYFLFTNHHDSLAITSGDRRYYVLKSPLQTKGQVRNLGKGYFQTVYDMLRENAAGLRSFFETWQISDDFNCDGPPPETRYMHELVNDSATELMAAVRKLISEADHPLLQADILSSKVLLEFLHDKEELHRVNSQQLASVLRDENYLAVGRCMIADERHYLWQRQGINHPSPEKLAAQRVKNNDKHLCYDILL